LNRKKVELDLIQKTICLCLYIYFLHLIKAKLEVLNSSLSFVRYSSLSFVRLTLFYTGGGGEQFCFTS